MKLYVLFVLITFSLMDHSEGVMKRMSCNSSGLTMTNVLCRMRPTSRTSVRFSLGVNVVKEIKEMLFTGTWMYKNGANWRQILKSPELEFCDFLSASNKLPYFQALLDLLKSLHPNLPWHCPIKPGRYESLNVNLTSASTTTLFKTIGVGMPNGLYRYAFHAHSDNDPMIFILEWTNEIYVRLGDDNF